VNAVTMPSTPGRSASAVPILVSGNLQLQITIRTGPRYQIQKTPGPFDGPGVFLMLRLSQSDSCATYRPGSEGGVYSGFGP